MPNRAASRCADRSALPRHAGRTAHRLARRFSIAWLFRGHPPPRMCSKRCRTVSRVGVPIDVRATSRVYRASGLPRHAWCQSQRGALNAAVKPTDGSASTATAALWHPATTSGSPSHTQGHLMSARDAPERLAAGCATCIHRSSPRAHALLAPVATPTREQRRSGGSDSNRPMGVASAAWRDSRGAQERAVLERAAQASPPAPLLRALAGVQGATSTHTAYPSRACAARARRAARGRGQWPVGRARCA